MVNRSVSGSKLSIWFIAEPCSSFINECSHGSWPFVIWVYVSLVHHWNLCKCRQGVLWMISHQLWWQEFGSFANVHQVDHLQSKAAIVSAVCLSNGLDVPQFIQLFQYPTVRHYLNFYTNDSSAFFWKWAPKGEFCIFIILTFLK